MNRNKLNNTLKLMDIGIRDLDTAIRLIKNVNYDVEEEELEDAIHIIDRVQGYMQDRLKEIIDATKE